MTKTPLITLPNRRTSSENVRVRLSMKFNGIMIGFGDAKVEVTSHAARSNAEPDHRNKDQKSKCSVGLKMRRRWFDARYQRAPVGNKNEDEQCAEMAR